MAQSNGHNHIINSSRNHRKPEVLTYLIHGYKNHFCGHIFNGRNELQSELSATGNKIFLFVDHLL